MANVKGKAKTVSKNAKQADLVKQPAHYESQCELNIECADAIRAAMGDWAFVAYCRGSALGYVWRADRKGTLEQDLRKGAQFLNMAADVASKH